MIPGYSNLLAASFNLFLNHELEYFGNAYVNYSGQLYSTDDPHYSQYEIQGSPFRQFVSDVSVTGATQISGVYQGSIFIPRASGLSIDFNMGRVLSTGSLSNVTAAYSFREFSVYSTNLDEADLLIEQSFTLSPQITQITGSLGYNQQPVPAIYIKNNIGTNVPWAFGGTDQSENRFTCIILATSPYQLTAVCSLLNDTARKYFPLFRLQDLPYGVLGDYKNPAAPYNYITLCQSQDPTSYIMVDKVRTSLFTEQVNKQINKEVFCALVDFDLISVRNPRRN